MDQIILIMGTIFVIGAGAIIFVLYLIQSKQSKKLKVVLDGLEVEKNIIDSSPIVPELSKVESLARNDKLDILYKDWVERFDSIKNIQIPKITDMLLDADYTLSKMDHKAALYKIAKLEMEIYKVRTNSEFLLGEIKEITGSEEKNRTVMTGLKSRYRELYQKFTEVEDECGEIRKVILLQFENISKRFEDFELIMENHEYTEVRSLVKAIEEMLKHMSIVLEEVPSIVLLVNSIIPKRMKEVEESYHYMTKNGYPLDYLNVEYNIEEALKKMNDILDRAKILNLEDSLLELRTLMQYFDSLFTDFEKEKTARREYEDSHKIFKIKMDKISKLVASIFKQVDDIESSYELKEEDTHVLRQIQDELKLLQSDYKLLMDHTGNKAFAYTKIAREMESLSKRLSLTEENLDNYLDTIGSMKDDEQRARQQLEEVKMILKNAKSKLREYHLPVIPRAYYTELKEASDALKEIVRELEKKPITIHTLNTRVDTARDLALKLFTKTQNMIKMARFSETAIVYGNRYRTTTDDLDKNLSYAEGLFYKGDYQKSLEITINALHKMEPEIYEKLVKLYGENE